jgi:hypothetical protein
MKKRKVKDAQQKKKRLRRGREFPTRTFGVEDANPFSDMFGTPDDIFAEVLGSADDLVASRSMD